MRHSYVGPYKVTSKAEAVVADCARKLGQSPETRSIEGLVLYITGDGCSLGAPSDEMPRHHRISIEFVSGDALQYQHLRAALLGKPGDSVRLIVDMLRNAEVAGTAFLHAYRDEIGNLLQCFGNDVVDVAQRIRCTN